MLHPPWIARTGGFAPRLSAYYAGYFMALGVQMPFFPVWLAAKGLEPRTIGLILATPMFVRLFAVPIITREVDRRDALRAAIFIGSAATALGYGMVGLMNGAAAILVTFALFALVFTPTMPMVDAYALRGIGQYGGSYGPVRLWGSASFILGSFGAGAVLEAISNRHLIWLIAGGYALTALLSLGLRPIASGEGGKPGALRGSALLRDPAFMLVLIAGSLIQASHALLYGFASIAWSKAGLSTFTIGSLSALAVTSEIVLFAVSARLPGWITPTVLLIFGASGAALRWTGMASDPPALLLPGLQCLHALSFAATHLGVMGFIGRATPPGLAATAQGYYAIIGGLIFAAATGSSGLLYAAYGHDGYIVMALIAGAGGLSAMLAHRRWKQGNVLPAS